MDWTDPIFLARVQFAFTVSFHFLFPALTIGLASYLAVLQGLHLWTGRQIYHSLFNYWVKVFAVAFAMGVVSGIVMTYQFGTNWSVFSDRAGPVIGPLMAYEVFTAFFLEAGFLGIMLFGLNRVGRGLHMFATVMVALGTAFSAFWILAVNSWMQTPAGHAINEAGQFVPTSYWDVIFNPSFPYRFVHTLLAAYLTTAFLVGAVGAYHLLRDRNNEGARIMFSMAMWMAVIVAPLQIIAGDLHGLNSYEHQPAKIAALEGHFETQAGAPFYIIGFPDMEAETTRYAISIPKAGSLILTHELNGVVKGLKEWLPEDRPYAPGLFWAFRIMVLIGFLMAAVGIWSAWLRWKGRLYDSPGLLRAALYMGPSGFIAVLAGWYVTEVGRQPYTVYGLLRTVESASPIDTPGVATSLLAFFVIYMIVFGAGTVYIIRLLGHRPEPAEPELPHQPIRTAGVTPAPALADEGPLEDLDEFSGAKGGERGA